MVGIIGHDGTHAGHTLALDYISPVGYDTGSKYQLREVRMHPYQEQTKILWELIQRMISAEKKESWIEAISHMYTMLEVGLRFLLSSEAGASGVPIPPEKIDRQRFLMELANLAKDKGFIDELIWKKIQEFNDIRKKAIHGLAKGEIKYEGLKEPALKSIKLYGDIQNCWLKIEWGPEETYENYVKGKVI